MRKLRQPTLSPEVTVNTRDSPWRQSPFKSGNRGHLEPSMGPFIHAATNKEVLVLLKRFMVSICSFSIAVHQLTITIDHEPSLPAKICHDIKPSVGGDGNGGLQR